MSDFLVKRDDLRECRVAESEAPALEPGQALLAVDSFGLTANNITYAVMGEAMSYWDFFPAADGWGRVPMWGFAEVERSEVDGVEAGTRVYGYLPPSSHLVVTPVSIEASGFVDGSPHRAALPSAYHRYLSTGADPFYRPGTEDLQMLLRPLFFTSFLIDDQLDDEGFASRLPAGPAPRGGAGRADLAAQRRFLGIYGRVVTYDAIEGLDRGPATFVDIAGAWHPFCEWIEGRLGVVHGQGFDAVRSAYLDALEGRVAPDAAHVVSLG